jgi:hypothetical protein
LAKQARLYLILSDLCGKPMGFMGPICFWPVADNALISLVVKKIAAQRYPLT